MSRTSSYRAISNGHLRAVKAGTAVLIDVEAGLAWLASLPAPTLKPQGKP